MKPPSAAAPWRTSAWLLASLMMCACAAERASVTPEGQLAVLGPEPAFSIKGLGDGWIVEGDRAAAMRRIKTTAVDRIPALRVESGRESFILARATNAHLLATPYLSWAWNMDNPGDRVHPVGLVVGFSGGHPNPLSWSPQRLPLFGTALPPHDRVLLLTWGRTALERGSLLPPASPDQGTTSYRPRGGQENAFHWWFETADLATLYVQAWPKDRAGRVRISFIGLAAAADPPSEASVAGHISGILLSR